MTDQDPTADRPIDGAPRMSTQNISIPRRRLAEFCGEHHIASLSLFGSVLRQDFGPESDVDVLVEFEKGFEPGLLAKAGMRQDLSDMLGRTVDLRVPGELSVHFRDRVLAEAEVQYVRR